MLEDLKVLIWHRYLPGLLVGQFFAELSADGENPGTGGDVTRGWKSAGENTDDRSANYTAVKWEKPSIRLDLTTGATSSFRRAGD
jgi:crotonobetainyl-CoA:carnitine CoA-transferase CaiB-like acyl-CoA transferase